MASVSKSWDEIQKEMGKTKIYKHYPRIIGALTSEIYRELKQGDKIEFRWWGNKVQTYIGRVEVKEEVKYYCPETAYDGDALKDNKLKYLETLDSFYDFNYFKIIN